MAGVYNKPLPPRAMYPRGGAVILAVYIFVRVLLLYGM